MPSSSAQNYFFKYLPIWGKYGFRWTMSALIIPFSSSILIACVSNGVNGKFQCPLQSPHIHLFLFTYFFIPVPVLLFLVHFFPHLFFLVLPEGELKGHLHLANSFWFYKGGFTAPWSMKESASTGSQMFWHRWAERICCIRRKSLSLRDLKAHRGLPS